MNIFLRFTSIAFVVAFSSAIQAKSPAPEIAAVSVMDDLNTIVIEGANFTADTPLLVMLGLPSGPGDITPGCTLDSDSMITCTLGSLPPAGDYLLLVSAGGGKDKQSGKYDLTIGAVGPEGPQGPQGPQGPAGTASITVSQGAVFSQVIPAGETKVWSWMIPAGWYLAFGRVNYRLSSDSSTAASIECSLKEEGQPGAYDFGEGFIAQDQFSTIPELRGVSTKGTMTLIGTVINAPENMHLAIECSGAGAFVAVDLAALKILPITSVLSLSAVSP